MKHFLLSVAAMFMLVTAYAGPVDFATAKKLAESVINNGDMSVEKTVEEVVLSAEVNSRMSVSPVEAPAFYVFEAEEGGFAIVSGDDAFPELIGYSIDGQISRNGSMPDARVAVAHGQMEKDELKDIWRMLVAGDIDILVCTTIVETGIDLPSANTLIIENADRFGLSQLHQIRGRVGRSERQAYAYFTYRLGKALSEIAEKRLSAIKEYAEFGAGFKIALCDLEIRGAGNLLGAQQHGYIDSVGYDLYVKLLNEAVLEERGESTEKRPEAQIDMRTSAHIPDSYIPAQSGRMEMYKKISLITCKDDAADVLDELIDRYGEPPRQVERLLEVALMKAICEEVGFSKVECREDSLIFHVGKPDLAVWSEVFPKHRGIRLAPTGDRVVYKFRTEPSKVGKEILLDYLKAKTE